LSGIGWPNFWPNFIHILLAHKHMTFWWGRKNGKPKTKWGLYKLGDYACRASHSLHSK
jgi:hypothetical protein